jgi:uncharacterized protein with FMN-binding domain
MKKYAISILVVITFAVFVLYQNVAPGAASGSSGTGSGPGPASPNSASNPSPNSGSTSAVIVTPPANSGVAASPTSLGQSASAATVPVKTATQTGQYKDGTYIGPVENAYFGNLQIQVAISGGKISDVTFLQYPNDNSHSSRVSNQAMPILKSEAISVQSANVDIVSGATQTSQAFQQSLAAVLSQAKA